MAKTRASTFLHHLRVLVAPPDADQTSDASLLGRFTATRDDAAFAELMRRHGGMVWSVCRRLVRQPADAEDAFQATFLVLARKAGSVRWRGTVAPWLYAVACRVARKAQIASARRPPERPAREAGPEPLDQVSGRELQVVLDAELARLPERLRAPLVLCYYQGLTRDEAARQLSWPLGTLKARLERGREVLRGRLARRGLALSTALSTGLLAETMAPTALAASTAGAVTEFVRDSAAAGALGARAVALAHGGVPMVGPATLGAALATGVAAAATGLWVMFAPPSVGPEIPPHAIVAADPQPPDAAAPARADRHGDALPAGATLRFGTARMRHKEGGHGVVFLKDGRIATAGGDRLIRVWDPASGLEVMTFRGGEHSFASQTLSPDGRVLAATDGLAIRLWDVGSGRELRSIPCETDVHNAVPCAFAPDGATLAAVAKDRSVRLFNAATGAETLRVPPTEEPVRCVGFTAEGKSLVTAGGPMTEVQVQVRDLADGKVLHTHTIKSPDHFRLRPLALAPDGTTLAVECAGRAEKPEGTGRTVYTQYDLGLIDVATGKERLRLPGECDVIWAAAFSPDGTRVGTHDMGRRLTVWDVATGRQLHRLISPPQAARPDGLGTLAFSADGTKVAAVGEAATVHAWDLATGQELGSRVEGHRAAVSAVAVSPDGGTIATGGGDHAIRLWDAATGQPRQVLTGHTAAVRSLAYSPDGRTLASACQDSSVRLWDAATGQLKHTIQAVPRTEGVYFGLCPLTFTPDSRGLIGYGDDRRLRKWDVPTGKEEWSRLLHLEGVPADSNGRPREMPKDGPSVQAVRISPDGSTVAVAAGSIHLIEVATGRTRAKLPGYAGPGHLAFSPDGRTLASAGWDKELRLWDAASGRELLKVTDLGHVNALAFAPDGRSVAAAAGWAEGVIHLIDARTGKIVQQLRGHGSFVGALAFTPDGRTLLSGQRDTAVLAWDITAGLGQLK